MTRVITFYTLEKKRVRVERPHVFFEFYEKQDDFFLDTSPTFEVRRLIVPVHHYGRILPNGKTEEEHYALHPQIQEFIERELHRKKYLDAETVNDIRAEDSRVIQALSEEVRDLKEEEGQRRKTITRYHKAGTSFATAPLWRRLYVAIFSPDSILPE